MLQTLLATCLLVLSAAGAHAADLDGRRTPNFLIFYIDDLGWKDTAHTGSDFYRTPQIDRLAAGGMTFTNAYAAAATCAPSRASLLSGQFPARTGYYGFAGLSLPRTRLRVRRVLGEPQFPSGDVTIAEALRDAGYQTGIVGKWQLGTTSEYEPAARGFTFSHVTKPSDTAPDDAGPKRIDEITKVSREFIARNRDRPFFLYISHLAVHTPLQASRESVRKHAARTPGEHHRHPLFAAMIERLDASVGEILEALTEHGVADDTLVLFTSDNGAAPVSSQAPLRGFKGSYYEAGIRVPLFARWPRVVKPGSRSDVPVNQVDIYPTLLAAAKVVVPEGKVLDGKSLLPLLSGSGPLSRESLFWHAPVYTGAGGRNQATAPLPGIPVSVIRKGHWKLLLFHDRWALDGGRAKIDSNGAVELYDLSANLDECCDQSTSQREKRDELLDELLAWIDETGATLATEPNPAYRETAPPAAEE